MCVGLIRTLRNRDEAVRVLRDFSDLLGRDGYDYWSKELSNCADKLARQTSMRAVFKHWQRVNMMISGWGSLTDQVPVRDRKWYGGPKIPYAELTDLEKAWVRFLKFFS